MILYYLCCKNKMHVYILTNENNEYEWKYIPGDDIINSQIIIKKNVNGLLLIYNFNADIEIDKTGRIHEHMNTLLGVEAGFNYERRIVSPSEIHFTKIEDNSNQYIETLSSRNVTICIEP